MAYNSYGEPQIIIDVKEEESDHDEDCEVCRVEQAQSDTCTTFCWAMALPVAIVGIFLGMVWVL